MMHRKLLNSLAEGSLHHLRIDGGDPDFVFASLDLTNPEAEDAVYDYMEDRNGDSGMPRS